MEMKEANKLATTGLIAATRDRGGTWLAKEWNTHTGLELLAL